MGRNTTFRHFLLFQTISSCFLIVSSKIKLRDGGEKRFLTRFFVKKNHLFIFCATSFRRVLSVSVHVCAQAHESAHATEPHSGFSVCVSVCVASGCWFVLDRDPTESLCGHVFPAARLLAAPPASPRLRLLSSFHQHVALHISLAFIVLMAVSPVPKAPLTTPSTLTRLRLEKSDR